MSFTKKDVLKMIDSFDKFYFGTIGSKNTIKNYAIYNNYLNKIISDSVVIDNESILRLRNDLKKIVQNYDKTKLEYLVVSRSILLRWQDSQDKVSG